MIDEGYASVTNRRVATKAGLKPALIQHYYPTMDALFLELYRRAVERSIERQIEAAMSARPLHELWKLSIDSEQTVLGMEFIALANHRKNVQSEIATYIERSRAIQAEALRHVEDRHPELPPAILSVLLTGARAIVIEEALGITSGHERTRALVETWIERLEPSPDSG